MPIFLRGMRINILEMGARVDVAVVVDINTNDPRRDEVTVMSLLRNRGEETTYASFGDRWKEIYSDPMCEGSRCYSPEGPEYVLEPILESVLE